MAKRMTVVLSQSPSGSPGCRHLEESLAAELLLEPNVELSIIPHLYDLPAKDTGHLFLRSVAGDMIVLAWLYPRAMHWLLDRNGIKGQIGLTQLANDDEEDDDERQPSPAAGISAVDVPDRRLYCMDLRAHSDPNAYLTEIRRIVYEASVQTVSISLGQVAESANDAATSLSVTAPSPSQRNGSGGLRRRWYPVIDYDRCTNCLECIDFCLFGVYGIDKLDRILVQEQDNCKQGCPACSRVCPENAIIFPEYKTPAIAGAAVGGIAGLKIDLSRLFGGDAAIDIAAKERDRELLRDGRLPVGLSVGIPKRRQDQPERQRDDLDDLVDSLDQLEL